MVPRRLAIVTWVRVWPWARATRIGCWTTCHHASRATSPAPVTTKTSRMSRRRRRESVRPSIDRSGLPGRDDERVAELVESQVDPQLADRRRAAQPVEVADHLLALALEGGLLVRQAIDVDPGGRDLDGLGQREEAQDEDDRDGSQEDD